MTPAIRVDRLGKRYAIGRRREPYRALRDILGGLIDPRRWPGRRRREPREFVWALKDVGFEVAPGEVVGIIGHNGAGKSTLLKILSRITSPTEGRVEIRGRVGSLLEVGTGFHPELTGGENIYLNGAILGMPRAEIARKFDAIVAFAEVDRFVDTPVKHYSTGMYLRLAFAVAAHLDPEILMVDEVLSVGDAAFQRRCLGKMQEVGEGGRTVLFVSHDLTAIGRLAARSMLVDQGRLRFVGPTAEAVRQYLSGSEHAIADLRGRTDRTGDGIIRAVSLTVHDGSGRPAASIQSGEPIRVAVSYESELESLDPDALMLDMRVRDAMGHPVVTFSTRFSGLDAGASLPGRGVLSCHVPAFALAEDTYSFDVWLSYRRGCADSVVRVADLRVDPGRYFETGYAPVRRKHGAALIRHQWTAGDPAAATAGPAAVEALSS
jgi:lipopolysaccharide transport system ATP-binding protein